MIDFLVYLVRLSISSFCKNCIIIKAKIMNFLILEAFFKCDLKTLCSKFGYVRFSKTISKYICTKFNILGLSNKLIL